MRLVGFVWAGAAAIFAVSVAALMPDGAIGASHTRSQSGQRLGQLKQLPAPDTWALGIFDPLGSDLSTSKQYYGLRHTDTWLDLFVQNPQGQWLVTAQHLSDAKCLDTLAALVLPTAVNPDCGTTPDYKFSGFNIGLMSQPAGLAMAPNPLWRPWTPGDATQTVTPDDHVRWTIPTIEGNESLTYGPQRFGWSSLDSSTDLTGSLVAPGSWYYLPTPREAGAGKSDMFYDNMFYRVGGSYSGQNVKGYLIIENMWGNTPYDETWWVHNRQQNWTAFTTSYDDGTTEYGQFYCGKYGSRGAVISNDRGQLVGRSYNLNAYLDKTDAVGTPQAIRFEFGNQRWQYTGNPQATILPGATGFSLSLGNVARIGERRKIVSSSAVQLTNGTWCSPGPLDVPAAQPKPHPLKLAAVRRRAHRLTLRVTCRNAPCAGTLSLGTRRKRVAMNKRGSRLVVFTLSPAELRDIRRHALHACVSAPRRCRSIGMAT